MAETLLLTHIQSQDEIPEGPAGPAGFSGQYDCMFEAFCDDDDLIGTGTPDRSIPENLR